MSRIFHYGYFIQKTGKLITFRGDYEYKKFYTQVNTFLPRDKFICIIYCKLINTIGCKGFDTKLFYLNE